MTRLYSYILGFALSIMLTLMAPLLLWWHEASHHQSPSHEAMYALFVLLAVLQLLVQLYFFLHMGKEARPRWSLTALCFALVVVAVLVLGTLWIMRNLEYGHTQNLEPFIGQVTPQTES